MYGFHTIGLTYMTSLYSGWPYNSTFGIDCHLPLVNVHIMKLSLTKVKKSITFENNFLLVVILVIWILFSLPAFFFYISNEESGTGWIVNIDKVVKLFDQTCIANTTRNSSTDEIESCGTLSGKKVK